MTKWTGFLAWTVLGLAAGCSRPESTDSAAAELASVLEIDRVVPVRRAQIDESLELVGSLIPWRFASIVAEVEGVVEWLPSAERPVEYEIDGRQYSQPVTLDIGHEVREGDVLVKIDPREYELALNVARQKLALAEAERDKLLAWTRPEEVEQLRAQYDEAVAVFEQAKLHLDRTAQLRDRAVTSKSEYENALTAHNTAKAAMERARAALRLAEGAPTEEEIAVAEAQVKLAEAEVSLRQDKLEKCTIRSPYDAVVVDRYVGVGDRVGPQVPIMQIVDPAILFAQVAVPERYQRLIQRNDLAAVESPGVSEPVAGVVALVNEKIDPETRTFRVRVGVENRRRDRESEQGERIFKSGSYVRVTLTVGSAPETLVVPVEAMTFDGGQPAVFVFHGDRVEKRPVRLGISSRAEYEIIGGLAEGERIVAGRTALLADGMPVRLVPRAAAPDATAAAPGAGETVQEPRALALGPETERREP